MKTIIALAAVLTVSAGLGTSLAAAGQSDDNEASAMQHRLFGMLNKLQSEAPASQERPNTYGNESAWQMLERMLRELEGESAQDDMDIDNSQPDHVDAAPQFPPMATETPTDSSVDGSGNRVFKYQSGPNQSADVTQHGSGNTATIIQGN